MADTGERAVEVFARALEPELWAQIDKWRDDDDWNGGTAANAAHSSLARARARLTALHEAGLAVVPVEPTEEMMEEGAIARHDAIKEAEAAYYKRHAHRADEDTALFVPCPQDWLPRLYRAMLAAAQKKEAL